MALKRSFLSALGIDAEKIEQIINAHAETVSALQDQIESAKAEADKKAQEAAKAGELAKEIEDLKKALDDEKKAHEGKDYDALKKEFDEYKSTVAKEKARASKEAAYKEILKDAGIPERHYAKILKYSDVDGVELDDKGKIKGAKDILKSLKEEWADHIEKTTETGASVATPPASTGGKMTLEQIDAIEDTVARQQAMAENLDLYGI